MYNNLSDKHSREHMDNNLEINSEDIIGKQPLLLFLFRLFTKNGKSRFIPFLLLSVIPLIILSAVTIYEERFFLQSVTSDIDNVGLVLGMSFLGDTMVWPFSILVPILLWLFFGSAILTFETIKTLSDKIIQNWEEKDIPENFYEVRKRTLNIFTGRDGYIGRFLRIAPYFVVLIFWVYNTSTCAFHQEMDKAFYPYKSTNIVVLTDVNNTLVETKKELSELVYLSKWDTDRYSAPLSTWTTRVWTLVFYGLPPFILSQFILMITGISYFLKNFREWSAKHKNFDEEVELLVKPFSDDGFSGLGFIANTGMMFFYTSFIFILLVMMSYFKEGVTPSVHNYLLIIILVPIAVYSFLAPAISIKNTINDSRANYLKFITERLNKLFSNVLITSDTSVYDSNNNKIVMLKILYDQVVKMEVWPFNVSTLFKMIFTLITPLILMLADKLFTIFLK